MMWKYLRFAERCKSVTWPAIEQYDLGTTTSQRMSEYADEKIPSLKDDQGWCILLMYSIKKGVISTLQWLFNRLIGGGMMVMYSYKLLVYVLSILNRVFKVRLKWNEYFSKNRLNKVYAFYVFGTYNLLLMLFCILFWLWYDIQFFRHVIFMIFNLGFFYKFLIF